MHLTINAGGISKAIAKNEARAKGLKAGLVRAATRVALRREAKSRTLISERQINNRVSSGRLAASINSEAMPAPGGIKITVGSNLIYARVQQDGGPVTPKTVKLLAIPANKQLRRGGIWPRDLPRGYMKFVPMDGPGKLRGRLVRAEDTDTVAAKKTAKAQKNQSKMIGVSARRRADSATGARRAGRKKRRGPSKGEAGETLFWLYSSTFIPARPYLIWDRDDRDTMKQEIRALIVRPGR